MYSTSIIAAFLSILAATAPSSSEARSDNLRGRRLDSNNNNNNDGDIVFDFDADDAFDPDYGIDESEYQAIVNYRHKIVDFWTPRRMKHAQPRHMTLNEGLFDFIEEQGGNNSTESESDGDDGQQRHLRNLQSVGNNPWRSGGKILQAAGRLMFKMEGNDYRCSATAVTDGDLYDGRSIIVTAGHCVYDDANGVVSAMV